MVGGSPATRHIMVVWDRMSSQFHWMSVVGSRISIIVNSEKQSSTMFGGGGVVRISEDLPQDSKNRIIATMTSPTGISSFFIFSPRFFRQRPAE